MKSMLGARAKIRKFANRLTPPVAFIPPLGFSAIAMAIVVVGGCRTPGPELVFDEGLSTAFSSNFGVVADDVGVSSFSFACDGIAHRVKVEFTVTTAAISKDETVWSSTPCAGSGLFLQGISQGNGGYQISSVKQYGVDLVLNEWRTSILPRFGSLGYSEAATAFVDKTYSERLNDLDVEALDMVCDAGSNRLRYHLLFLKPPKGRGLNYERSEGATSMPCPANAEKGHALFQATTLRDPRTPSRGVDGRRYRVVTVKNLNTDVLSQFFAELLKNAGRQQTF